MDPAGRLDTKPKSFRSRLFRPDGVGTWTFADIPGSVIRALALRPRMRVAGTIDGVPIRSSLMPRGGGSLFIVVPGAVRERIGKSAGDPVELSLVPDARPVVIRVPGDLRSALGPEQARFDRLAPSHRKAFVQWIESAKQAATRERRVAQAVEMVRRGETRT
jgi:bifunctional DNA-binding transcriptional regulator/antitoxin component of YhaV-PrlF toxin-antitoxin module